MENTNMVKIVVPISEDATMLSFASIAATDDDVRTTTREYDGDEIEDMKKEYLMLAATEEKEGNPIVNGILVGFTVLLTLILLFLTTMFIVLWKWPDSSVAFWFDSILSVIMDRMAGL